MDKKQNTARAERRKKWWDEAKKAGRVTRARSAPGTDAAKPKVLSPRSTTLAPVESSRGFRNVTTKRLPGSKKKVLKSAAVKQKVTTNSNEDDSNQEQKMDKKSKANTQVPDDKSPRLKQKEKDSSEQNGREQTASIYMPKKYVLFVGNLPYDVTKQQIEDHFRKTGGVKAVRIPKEKGTDRAKGFAYVEFNSHISHRIALRLHQTTLGGRKINVEFTSIGGNNEKRQQKLKEKNQKLSKFKL